MTSQPRLAAHFVSKTYGPVKVLDDVDLVIHPGEVHALIGQNGSGKSTLVKILTGYHGPDKGAELEVDGTSIALPVQWRDAAAAGVSVVHQDLGLLDDRSVSENIGIGGFVHSKWTGKIDWRAQAKIATQALDRLGLTIDPHVSVGSLSVARRAEVAIARAIRDLVPGQGVVILDEATRSLPRDDLHHFHDLLRKIAASGTSILMVTHSLDEVLDVSTRVTVLRDGRPAAAGVETATLSAAGLARLMLGRTVDAIHRDTLAAPDAKVIAQIDGASIPGHLPLDLTVRAGEVVGVTGLPGTGFEALPHVLAGGRRTPGRLRTGRGLIDLKRSSVSRSLRMGIAMVPERRIDEGLARDLTIVENISLPSIRRRGRPWFVARGWQQRLAYESIRRFGIKTDGAEALISELSGGNQQKVLLAKWLSVNPELLVLHEPTQAVDVGARADILRAIVASAEAGAGVLLVSTEPGDLAEICDRVLVLHPGLPPIELRTDDPEQILDAIYAQDSIIGDTRV